MPESHAILSWRNGGIATLGRSTRTAGLYRRRSTKAKQKTQIAAKSAGPMVSELVSEDLRVSIHDTLRDRKSFGLQVERSTTLMGTLDNSPREILRVVCLFKEPSVLNHSES
jgi:uncharacterized protein (DUF1778 family)